MCLASWSLVTIMRIGTHCHHFVGNQHSLASFFKGNQKEHQVFDCQFMPHLLQPCLCQEHKYKGFEGTREVLEVLQHLNEVRF